MTLAAPPKHFRAAITRGLNKEANRVDRKGGMFGAGLIEGVAVISRGEALGHDLWIDQPFVDATTDAINGSKAESGGIKVRFTHPGMSSDGIGNHLGRLVNARTVGDRSIADLHFNESSHKTPDGDLADYVMSLAEETPDAFGLSIVFERDLEAEEELNTGNTVDELFISPDEDNKNNFRHARLQRLRAGDVVDEPAANPDGLFSVVQAPQNAEEMLTYVFGMSDDKPETFFGVDADRVSGFVARFLDRHNLELKEKEMANETKPERSEAEIRADLKAESERYVAAFGPEGAEWFLDGVSFEDGQNRQIEALKAEREQLAAEVSELKETIASLELGDDPVDGEGESPKQRTFAEHTRRNNDTN